MFAPSDFSGPGPARPPIQHDRFIGALVLLVCVILCVIMVIGVDRSVFIPYNATHAVTQTWQAQHPTQPGNTPARVTPQPRRTATPVFNQQAWKGDLLD